MDFDFVTRYKSWGRYRELGTAGCDCTREVRTVSEIRPQQFVTGRVEFGGEVVTVTGYYQLWLETTIIIVIIVMTIIIIISIIVQ